MTGGGDEDSGETNQDNCSRSTESSARKEDENPDHVAKRRRKNRVNA